MIVYRFEAKIHDVFGDRHDWKGVFHTSIGDARDADYATHGCTLPDHKYYDDSRFACRSIDKLISYFGSDFARLIGMNNVRLMAYEVNAKDLIYSDKHCEVVFKTKDVISKRKVVIK